MRPLLLGLVVLLAVLLIADGLASAFTERRVAEELQRSAALETRPEVAVQGSPFLTQALSGRYEQVDVTAEGVDVGDGVRARRVDAVLRGVEVPLGDLLGQPLERLRVETVEAEALLGFDDLEARFAPDAAESLELSAGEQGDDTVRVEALAQVAGRELAVTADGQVRVEAGDLVVTATDVRLGDREGSSGAGGSTTDRLTGGALDFTVPVEDLQPGLELVDVRVVEEGLVAVVHGDDVVFGPGPGAGA